MHIEFDIPDLILGGLFVAIAIPVIYYGFIIIVAYVVWGRR